MLRSKVQPAFNRWFRWEEINGDGLCPTYLWRLVLLKLPGGRRLYLHHFVGDDWSIDAHDHPKVFWSLGFRGAYDEDVLDTVTREVATTRWRAPWLRRFSACHAHRIRSAHLGGAWTLVYTGPVVREWGFWLLREAWIPFRQYLSQFGAERKACE